MRRLPVNVGLDALRGRLSEAKAMIRECLNPNQDSRPDITQVLKSSYFTPTAQLGRANSGLSQGRTNQGGTPSRDASPGLPKAPSGLWNGDQAQTPFRH